MSGKRLVKMISLLLSVMMFVTILPVGTLAESLVPPTTQEQPLPEEPAAPAEEPKEDAPADAPAEQSEGDGSAPAAPPAEEPAEQPSEEPTEQPTEEPAEEPTEQPTEQPVEQPAEEPEVILYKVRFIVGDVIRIKEVKAGEKVAAPSIPEAPEGKEFDGWYVKDSSDSDPFDFDTLIEKDIDLVARFKDVAVEEIEFYTITVKYKVADGGAAAPADYSAKHKGGWLYDNTVSSPKLEGYVASSNVVVFSARLRHNETATVTYTKVAQAPVVEEPVIDEPNEPAEQPAEQPTTDEPAEEPKADEPVEQPAEEPTVDEPAEQPAEQPKADEPAEEPTVDEPAEQPAEEPTVDEPADEPAETVYYKVEIRFVKQTADELDQPLNETFLTLSTTQAAGTTATYNVPNVKGFAAAQETVEVKEIAADFALEVIYTENKDAAWEDDAEEEPIVEEPVVEEPTHPAQSFTQVVGSKRVSMSAPEGSLPAGTTMVARAVGTSAAKEAVERSLDENQEVKEIVAIDITLYGPDGSEVQPLIPVKVTFTNMAMSGQTGVYHVSGSSAHKVGSGSGNVATATANSFSVYVIVTIDEKQASYYIAGSTALFVRARYYSTSDTADYTLRDDSDTAYAGTVTWSVAKQGTDLTKVSATITSNGRLTVRRSSGDTTQVGTVVFRVTAKDSNGNEIAYIDVTVAVGDANVGIVGPNTLYVGGVPATYAIKHLNSSDFRNRKWSLNEGASATINSNNGQLTPGQKAEVVTVTFSGTYGSGTYTGTKTVVITGKPAASIDKSVILVGGTATATASGFDANQTVTWTSSDDAVATVNNGVVTGVAVGTATITASWKVNTAENGVLEKSASVDVRVRNPLIIAGEHFVKETETITLTTENAAGAVTWTSSDETVATVADGVVTGVKGGTVTITAIDSDGISATHDVTVGTPCIVTFTAGDNGAFVDPNDSNKTVRSITVNTLVGATLGSIKPTAVPVSSEYEADWSGVPADDTVIAGGESYVVRFALRGSGNTTDLTHFTFYVDNAKVAEQYVANGETLLQPESPVKADHRFIGWYRGAAVQAFGAIDTTKYEAEVHVDAKFQPIRYITFIDDQGRVAYVKEGIDNETVALDKTLDISGAVAFTGWSSVQNEATTRITSVTLDGANVTVYAIVESVYWVTYDVQGGSYVAPAYVLPNATAFTPAAAPSRQGYTFLRWSETIDGEAYTGVPKADITLHAVWQGAAGTSYIVIHELENADDDGYSFYKYESKTGITGERTAATFAAWETGPDAYFTDAHFTRPTSIAQQTIAGDGTTVVRVRYTRDTFSMYFSYDGSGTADITITAKYQAKLTGANAWPQDQNGSSVWVVCTNNTTWPNKTSGNSNTIWQANCLQMPDYDQYFKRANLTGNNTYSMHYYVEVLPGETGTTIGNNNGASNTSLRYKLHHTDTMKSSSLSSTAEDRYDIQGFTYDNYYTGSGVDFKREGSTSTYYLNFCYTRNKYPLVYHNGDLLPVTVQVPYEMPLTSYNNPTPQRPTNVADVFVFAGWYADETFTTPFDFTKTMPTTSVDLYAKWKSPTFTGKVYYTVDAHGSSDEITAIPYGGNIDPRDSRLDTSKLVRPTDIPDAEFVCWCTKTADGTLVPYNFDTEVYSDFELYPLWRSTSKFTVVYQADDATSGAVPTDSTLYADGGEAIVLAGDSLSKTGKVFVGWKLGDKVYYVNNRLPIDAHDANTDKEIVLTAVWDDTESGIKVTYYSNGVKGEEDGIRNNQPYDVKGLAAAGFTLPTDPNGGTVTFLGWATSENGAVQYQPDATIRNLKSSLNLYAQYKTAYKVTYQYTNAPTGADAVPAAVSYKYGAAVAIAAEPAEVTGYTFGGWKKGGVAAESFTMPASDVTITGAWTANSYTISYYLDGALQGSPDSYTYGAAVTARSLPTKTGHSVTGWYASADADETTAVVATMPASDLSYYAKSTVNSYLLTVNYVGPTDGQFVAPATHTEQVNYTAGYSVASPAVTGYTPDIATVTGTMPAQAVTVTVTYSANTNTAYKVEHYTQDLVAGDAEQTWKLAQTDSTAGKTGAAVVWTQGSFTGFAFDGSLTENGTAKIGADGKTVVKLFYTRNSYDVVYKITEGAGDFETENYKTVSYKYEEAVTAEVKPSQTGYTFNGWTGEPATMPANAVEVTGYYTAAAVDYKVEFYYQNIANNLYTQATTETQTISTAKTGDSVSFTPAAKEGFTLNSTASTLSGTVAANGSLVLKVYYDRNAYDVVYKITEGAGDFETENYKTVADVKYGAALSLITDDMTQQGYTWSGWTTLPATMPAEAVEVTGSYGAATNTAYKVEHYTQDLVADGAVQTWTLANTEPKTGTTGETVTWEQKAITGFAFDSNLTENGAAKIGSDGKTVVKLFYTRNSYPLTYKITGSYFATPDGEAFVLVTNVKYGAALTLIANDMTQQGYTWGGWTGLPATMPAKAVTVTGSYTEGQADYKVEFYYQNIANDLYTQETTETQTVSTAKTGDSVSFTPAAKEGFTLNSTASTLSGTVAADGSLVLKVYYDRSSYDVVYKITGTLFANANYNTAANVKYGTALTLITDNMAKQGYNWSGWTGLPATMPAKAVEVTGSYTEGETSYKVEHYKQNIDGTYPATPADVDDSVAGITGQQTTAAAKTYTGFTAPTAIIQQTIAADGSTVIKLYYTRNSYTLTYKITEGDGEFETDSYKTASYKYEETVTAEAKPAQTGYTFNGWTNEPATMPAANQDVTGYYTADVVGYKVEFYYQNILNDEYAKQDGETVVNDTAKTGDAASYTPEAKTGFTLNSTMSTLSGTVAGDGSLVLSVYYDRNVYDLGVTYQVPTGFTAPAAHASKVKYGATYSVSSPTVQGLNLRNAADATITGTMPAEAVEITVTYTAVRYNVYYETGYYGNTVTNMPANSLNLLAGSTYTIPAGIRPNRSGGYAFDRWETSSLDGSADTFLPGESFTMPENDVYISANWLPDPFHVRYFVRVMDVDGNVEEDYSLYYDEYAHGSEAVPAPASTPARAGYVFGGWDNVPARMPDDDVNIYGTLREQPVVPPTPVPPSPTPEIVPDDAVPLAAPQGRAWALLNLILAIVTALASVLMLIGYFGKKKDEDENGVQLREIKRHGAGRLATLIPGIGGIIAFILTENMRNPMVFTDKWTLLMAVIALIQLGIVLLSLKSEKDVDPTDVNI